MTSTDRMVAWLREAMDAAQRDAEAAPAEPLRAADTIFGPEVHVGDGDFDGKWSREGQGMEAAYRCDDPYDDCASARHGYLAEARLIATHASRAAVLRRIAADQELVADFLTETHFRNEEDNWYSCAALTDEDGEPVCFDDTRAPGPCDCGRDSRVERRVRLLAEGYGWTEEAP